ncbi:MAG TPA: hypothetical protein DCE18_11250 [Syntrophobacteraceae bacterium]|nr:hypothetical protein [Syntrophobacteraceae bacterium]
MKEYQAAMAASKVMPGTFLNEWSAGIPPTERTLSHRRFPQYTAAAKLVAADARVRPSPGVIDNQAYFYYQRAWLKSTKIPGRGPLARAGPRSLEIHRNSLVMRNHILDKPQLYQWTLDVARTLPPPVLYGMARLTGALVYAFSRRDRRNLRHNLQLAFKDTRSLANQRVIAWKMFQNYAMYMVDFFRLLGMDLSDSRRCVQLYEGQRHLDAALGQGRGVLLLTAHVGNWEIGGFGLRALGYPVTVVALKHNSDFTNRLINTMRSRHNIGIIELGSSAYDGIEILRALQRQEIVAMLGDRVFADRAGATTMFGQPVQLPLGPVLLAMSTGAPIVPAFSVMEAPGRYRGIIEPALDIRRGPDREVALQHNLRQVASVFERAIRRFPDQWYQIDHL